MNGTDWLNSCDPVQMLAYLQHKAGGRKLRLFACACARRYWDLLRDRRSREAVETAERFADGLVGPDEIVAAREAAEFAVQTGRWLSQLAAEAAMTTLEDGPWQTANALVGHSRKIARTEAAYNAASREDEANVVASAQASEYADLSDLARHIFGIPFPPRRVNPVWLHWRDGVLIKMARLVYDERRFADLPILADALEDAGCDDAALLAHCRAPERHSRGCWVIDTLRGVNQTCLISPGDEARPQRV